MTRILAYVSLLALTACTLPPPPAQLAPSHLAISLAPIDVVRRTAQELTAAGFEIVQSDATGGLITAKRVRTPQAQGTDVECRYAHDSIADRNNEAHFTVSVTATPANNGSNVQIVSGVVAKSGNSMPPILRSADSADDCSSTGAVEQRIVDALKR